MPSDQATALKQRVIKRAQHDKKFLQDLLDNPDAVLTQEAGGIIPKDFRLTTAELGSLEGVAVPDSLVGGCIKC